MIRGAAFDLDGVATLLRRRLFGVGVNPVIALGDSRPVAIELHDTTPERQLDVGRIMTVLRTIRLELGVIDVPLIFELPLERLADLPPADGLSRRALVVAVDADAVLVRPATALRAIADVRDRGWEVGLAGVGRTPRSLPAVTVVEPGVIMLDAGLLAPGPGAELLIETLTMITAVTQANGAAVLATGVDTPERRSTAVRLGATLAVGGAARPTMAPLPADLDSSIGLFVPPPRLDPGVGIYELAARRHDHRLSTKPMLVDLSRHLEHTAMTSGATTMVLAAFQHARNVGRTTAARFARLRQNDVQTVMAARGLREAPSELVIGIERGDTLIDEWILLVLGPAGTALLAARDRKNLVLRDRDRAFDWVLSYDRDLAAHAARSLLLRSAA